MEHRGIQRWRVRALLVVAIVVASCGLTEGAPCRGYAALTARAIKARVEALRLVEREAADRLLGLDTRPYPFLAAQARAEAAALAQAQALQEEDELDRCPDPVPHVRRLCATAALALAGAIEEQAAGAVSPASRQAYAEAMAICEGHMRLTPVRTRFRTLD